jgi:hypothetical protein
MGNFGRPGDTNAIVGWPSNLVVIICWLIHNEAFCGLKPRHRYYIDGLSPTCMLDYKSPWCGFDSMLSLNDILPIICFLMGRSWIVYGSEWFVLDPWAVSSPGTYYTEIMTSALNGIPTPSSDLTVEQSITVQILNFAAISASGGRLRNWSLGTIKMIRSFTLLFPPVRCPPHALPPVIGLARSDTQVKVSTWPKLGVQFHVLQ